MQYHPKVNDVLFLQEKVLGLVDSRIKKSSVYLSVLSGIECHLDNGECNKYSQLSIMITIIIFSEQEDSIEKNTDFSQA